MKYLATAGVRRGLTGILATALVSSAAAFTLAAPAQASPEVHYSFKTVNNNNDPTFNQLLGINDAGKIAGVLRLGRQGPPQQGLHPEAAVPPG